MCLGIIKKLVFWTTVCLGIGLKNVCLGINNFFFLIWMRYKNSKFSVFRDLSPNDEKVCLGIDQKDVFRP